MRKVILTALAVLLIAPATSEAAVRHALQAELYGLTAAQRTNGAAQINAALDSEAVEDVEGRMVIASKTTRHGTCLFVEVNFSTDGAGQRIFNTARNWASTRSEDAAGGFHSYVRVRSVDDVARTITQRYAESPGWVADVTVEDLDSLL